MATSWETIFCEEKECPKTLSLGVNYIEASKPIKVKLRDVKYAFVMAKIILRKLIFAAY